MTDPVLESGQMLQKRYVVKQLHGEGGMQQVFQAIDISFERLVALKTPKNATAEKRFARSAVVSAKVAHGNVAKTLDYFEEDGRAYLVEEFIPGRDLSRVLDEEYEFLDPHQVAFILHRLGKGVAAAHHAGVFHRDLKPSNIMVSADPNFSDLRITDFGIAKMAQREIEDAVEGLDEGNESSLTGSQTAMGALPYMAPEMITQPKSATTPADIWAIGAIAYRLLAGKTPFGAGLGAVPAIIEAKLPPMPVLLRLKKQFTPIGDELWAIVAKCMSKSPADRPNADQLVSLCSQLCYSDARRELGTISSVRPKGYKWGYIWSDEVNEEVFFHEESFYQTRIPIAGEAVAFASFSGEPYARAFPVLPRSRLK